MSWEAEVEEIRRRREAARGMGGPEGLARRKSKGLLNIRERIDGLADAGSFRELGPSAGASEPDGGFTPANYLVGFAEMNGRPCILCISLASIVNLARIKKESWPLLSSGIRTFL